MMLEESVNLESYIRDIPDFPKKGIIFKDITPLLMDPAALGEAVDRLYNHFAGKEISKVVAIESRGFIFGGPLSLKLGAGFVPVRKPGKLPYKTRRREYALEYGTDALEIHTDGVCDKERALIIDDLLATGGTAEATAKLVEQCGGEVVGFGFVIELGFLDGRSKLKGYDVLSLIRY
jgi:adenine phosphoribosyltransferase